MNLFSRPAFADLIDVPRSRVAWHANRFTQIQTTMLRVAILQFCPKV